MNPIVRTFFYSCLKATELIEKKLHVKLSIRERILLKIHNILCKPCADYEKQSRAIENCISHKHSSEKEVKINIEELKAEILARLEKR